MLRVVYRSYGGENWKNRPPFYSKRVALLSCLRAARRVDAELLFMNDGPVDPDLHAVMSAAGEVVELPRLGMRGSYVAGLKLPQTRNWAPDDVVWFSEDDYLYRPEAFERLEAAAKAVPAADYFALFGRTWAQPGEMATVEPPPLPRGWPSPDPVVVDGQEWRRLLSTSSTFGGRVGALRADYGVMRFVMFPHRQMYRDHDTCVVIQGYEPHPWSRLGRSLLLLEGDSAKERARGLWLAPFLAATNLRSHRRAANRRTFLVANPNLAVHLETDLLSPGTDWQQVAADVEDWAASEGLLARAAVES